MNWQLIVLIRLLMSAVAFLVTALVAAVVFPMFGQATLLVVAVFFAAIAVALALDHGMLSALADEMRKT